MKVLVCGGRNYDKADVWNWLEQNLYDHVYAVTRTHPIPPLTTIIHGGAQGADEGAGDWAKSEGCRVQIFKADWKKHGKAAGPIRNQQMIDVGQPDIVIAFPGGKGTADMVRRASAAGVPVIEVSP